MEFIEYFTIINQEYWLSKIDECDWNAGKYLCYLLKNNKLKELLGENARVLLLIEGENLISFCTLADKDDIDQTDLKPWIGFVYTFPEYRGKRYMKHLISFAEHLVKLDGNSSVYISTNHEGLYEKCGYTFLSIMKDINGEDSRVYVRYL